MLPVEQVELKDRGIPGDIKNYISDLETVNNSLKVKSTSLENEAIILKEEIEDLQAKLHLALFKKYGRSSEKIDPTQIDFFEVSKTDEESIEEDTPIIVAAHPRKKPGRKALDPAIPRKIIVHDIAASDKICGCGHELVKVGEEITERLQIIPERVYVEQHVRPKWACRHCEGSGDEENPVFRIATTPPTMIPGSIVTAGLLAFIFVNKFVDHLPFYRQEKRFERIGVHISRQNMSNWSLKVYETLKPLEKLLKQEAKAGPYIQMDETPLQVMGEKGRADTSKSYMWLARGGPPETPVIYYNYQETRKAQFIKDLLEDYHGYIQSDGYKGYESALKGNKDIIHVGCLAHARREFFDATKASKKAGSAHIALKKIANIYHKEKELKNLELENDELLKRRKDEVKPLLDGFKEWLDDKSQKVRPSSETGKAIRYTLGQWNKIIKYIECAELTPDNNAAERSIKPFVVGRKNWLFSGSPSGANASALLFSLIETAKVNDLNPYGYLKWIFEETPLIKSEKDFEKFLPKNCDRDKINQFQFNGL
ncbi:MAG: IS66 family transposase [Bacteroidetes bacterium]|nr:MAG: IS66 family transposase [Bacteroidota bacterium]